MGGQHIPVLADGDLPELGSQGLAQGENDPSQSDDAQAEDGVLELPDPAGGGVRFYGCKLTFRAGRVLIERTVCRH